ncbi:MAG: hypothetical protein QOD99_2496 [Chthoniobacter sp.]|jgi:hypothetical protein|nr:hypothetical protein [Chthoniobacter sp.]
MKTKRKITYSLLIAGVLLIPPIWFFVNIAASIGVPNQIKLADYDRPAFHFSCPFPPGTHFDLVLGVPRSTVLTASYSGRVRVSESGHSLTEFTFDSATAQECNWLHSPELQGYILTWQQHAPQPRLLDLLRSRHTYDFCIESTQQPPTGSSLWLAWMQRARD